ncbi:hypothetical protein BGX30_007828 [Mortierella sp. GBA39]|nr:hypothetical protein BGX30_007828 [Mortierella sp. GBA39]
MSSFTISTPSVSSSPATGTASSAFATATATESTGNSSRNGNTYASCTGMDCSNSSYGLGPLSLKSVFYFIGFLGLVIALFYTIFMIRRRRRHNNRRRDPEMAEQSGANATYRPDSGDEVSPPQYRAYILDEPYTDLESPIVYPDSVHYGTEQGLIQHFAVLQQQEPPRSSSTTAAAGTTEGGEAETTTSTAITEPAPAHAHAHTFFNGRHLSILRMGLSNYSHNHSRSSRPNNNRSLAVVMPPTLPRLRSMGPPPYIPTSDDEEAPALPPSYNVVVEISSAPGTSSTIAATPSSEIAAH